MRRRKRERPSDDGEFGANRDREQPIGRRSETGHGIEPARAGGCRADYRGDTGGRPPTPSQPAGFAASLSGQQAVTASAVALASNASQHFACVKAFIANTISVYIGPTGETISTGYELGPGDERCYLVTNTNLLFVIASTTGASVSWTAQ